MAENEGMLPCSDIGVTMYVLMTYYRDRKLGTQTTLGNSSGFLIDRYEGVDQIFCLGDWVDFQ